MHSIIYIQLYIQIMLFISTCFIIFVDWNRWLVPFWGILAPLLFAWRLAFLFRGVVLLFRRSQLKITVRCIWMGDIYCIHLIAESVLISFLIVFDMSPCYVPYIDHSPNKSRWIKMKSSSHFMSLGDTHFAK